MLPAAADDSGAAFDSVVAASSWVSQPLIGLYDAQGVLRCTGSDLGECLAYAEFFALDPGVCSLVSLR